MKNSKEMADAVFLIRDAYVKKKKKRVRIFKGVITVSTPIAVMCILTAAMVIQNVSFFNIPTVLDNNLISSEILSNSNNESVFESSTESNFDNTNESNKEEKTQSEKEHNTSKDSSHKLVVSSGLHSEKKSDIDSSESLQENSNDETYVKPEDTQTQLETDNNNIYEETSSDTIEYTSPDTDAEPQDEAVVSAAEEEFESISSDYNNWSTEDIYQLFPFIDYNNMRYICVKKIIYQHDLILAIDTIDVTGYNSVQNEEVSASVTVYLFNGCEENNEIAIWFQGKDEYYVYKISEEQE